MGIPSMPFSVPSLPGGAGVLTDFTKFIQDHLTPGGGNSQPPQQAPPPTAPVDPKAAAATVPQPTYQYPFSPLQAQVFLTHFLAPYLQQAQTPSMPDAAKKLEGMGYKINPQQTTDLTNVQNKSADALQASFGSPMISFINMLTQQQGQDKATNQALRDNYVTALRTAMQGVNGTNPNDLLSGIASILQANGVNG